MAIPLRAGSCFNKRSTSFPSDSSRAPLHPKTEAVPKRSLALILHHISKTRARHNAPSMLMDYIKITIKVDAFRDMTVADLP